MDHKVQSKYDIITDFFLEEGIIHFSGVLEVILPLILTYKNVSQKINGEMEGGLSPKK